MLCPAFFERDRLPLTTAREATRSKQGALIGQFGLVGAFWGGTNTLATKKNKQMHLFIHTTRYCPYYLFFMEK
jgi:hypothetical protein